MTHLLDGYRRFAEMDEAFLDLVEPLRFLRMLHYLHWQARQTGDVNFLEANPGWGSAAFWLRQVEDLSEQYRRIAVL